MGDVNPITFMSAGSMTSFVLNIASMSLKKLRGALSRRAIDQVPSIDVDASGETFTVKPAGRGALIYEEYAHRYLMNVIEGDGYTIVVENMGDVDLGLNSLRPDEKLRIAFNIKRALSSTRVAVEVHMGNRVLTDPI